MLQSHKKSRFPHFLRKWSESMRTALLFDLADLKLGLCLSTFIFVAEKMRKISKVCLSLSQFTWRNPNRNNGLSILFPFIPKNL